ncbi:chorismate mutase [Leptotrichia sp. OH3620_COT-345]|uniref:chorismate mutase n=1 Tax=Leptotrichia sp. OH3620_COT-345 TaxID=2491048 RepID=UPI000F64E58D|nr:chorismate mutase [Leptotrichia sp. OH3620_COT-345]RRD39128.1 chorismate mutase [Leptotrichia sp. OH3620_COT-345]
MNNKKITYDEIKEKLDLNEIRGRIDRIDRELVKMLENRLKIVKEVAIYKKMNNMKIFDSKREEEVIEKNLKNISDENIKYYINILLNNIMNVSKEYQKAEIEKDNQ